jgi:hypothetical protein
MKIRYFSDFHLELIKPHKVEKRILRYIPSGLDEICILAGDIGNPYHSNYDVFMKFISKHFKKKHLSFQEIMNIIKKQKQYKKQMNSWKTIFNNFQLFRF